MALPRLIEAVRYLEPGESPVKIAVPRPGIRRVPLVVDVPHSGLLLPRSLSGPMDDERKRRFVVPGDTGVNGVVRRLGDDLPFPIVHLQVVRAAVDANREPFDVRRDFLIGIDDWEGPAWRPWSDGGERGMGVFAEVCDLDGSPLYPEGGIQIEDARRRLREVYYPYVDALGGQLRKCHELFDRMCSVGLHSCARDGRDTMGGGRKRRPDICVSDGSLSPEGRTAPAALTEIAVAAYRRFGLDAQANDPFVGGHALHMHSRYLVGRFALQVEICKEVILQSETTLEHDPAGMDLVAQATRAMLDDVAAFCAA